MNNLLRNGSVAALVLAVSSVAMAQTGPGLVLQTWDAGQWGVLNIDAGVLGDSETDSNSDVDLYWTEAEGRVRLDQLEQPLSIGYQQFYIDIDDELNQLPNRVLDQSLAVGSRVGEFRQWDIYATAGVGFASDSPYDDGEGYYGLASIVGVRQIDANRSWIVALSYDGNRAIFPDVPLPAVAYQVRASETLSYMIGLPVSRVWWRPHEAVWLSIDYSVPVNFNAKITYAMAEQFHLFGAFTNRFVRFHTDDGGDTDYMFFEQRRLEAGVDWRASEMASIIVAGGYAFDQEFSAGWDVRDTDAEIELDAAPYLRVGVDLRF